MSRNSISRDSRNRCSNRNSRSRSSKSRNSRRYQEVGTVVIVVEMVGVMVVEVGVCVM